MKREIPILFFVNRERTVLFSMKRDVDPPLYHPLLHALPKTEIYLDFYSMKNAGIVFAADICDLSVFGYNFYSKYIAVELSFVQSN